MKIVVLDGYALNPGDISWEMIRQFGELEVFDRTGYDLSGQSLVVERGKDAKVILTNKTPVSRGAIDQLPKLKYIGVLATGYNIVDVTAAKEKGIVVTNIPAYGTAAVAQMAIALILELCHHAGAHNDAVKKGEWTNHPDWSFWKYPLVELDGKTLGIVGFGRIGQATAKIAQAMGMKIVAHTPRPQREMESDTLTFGSLSDVWKKADFISLHCPLFRETEGLINHESISQMKDGVRIVNTSRGALIEEKDLAEALKTGKVAGAAVDVVSQEPIRDHNPLLCAPNCLITPHISWAPIEARRRLMKLAAENLTHYIKGHPINVVNP